MMRSRSRYLLVLGITLPLTIIGCSSVPLVADSSKWGSATLDEQYAWVLSESEAALSVLGQSEGWWEFDPSYRWPEQQESIIEDLRTATCVPSKSGEQPGRVALRLRNQEFQQPFAAAKLLRQHWVDEGWDVTNVIDPATAARPEIYFRADRDDGAVLSLKATQNLVVLIVQTSCSDEPSALYQ